MSFTFAAPTSLIAGFALLKGHFMQVTLTPQQLRSFYHDEFVQTQIENFCSLVDHHGASAEVVTDIGGGVGFFGSALREVRPDTQVRVIDLDPKSVQLARKKGVEATLGDAINPPVTGDEDIVCFNLILHHLIAPTELGTLDLQAKALLAWKHRAKWIFIDEYIYDSYFGNFSGKLIFFITRSKLLSSIARVISRIVPSLNANTFGIGVRFRSEGEWRQFFEGIGLEIVGAVKGVEEHVSLARRLLLIRSCRRDSFLLRTVINQNGSR